jgi:hypothetical protein
MKIMKRMKRMKRMERMERMKAEAEMELRKRPVSLDVNAGAVEGEERDAVKAEEECKANCKFCTTIMYCRATCAT